MKFNYQSFHAQSVRDYLQAFFLPNHDSQALLIPGDRTLILQTQNALDFATLTQSASLTFQYLQLNEGEIAICNDFAAGSTHPCQITFVLAMSLMPESQGAVDLIWAYRLPLAKTFLGESLRIPPTPLGKAKDPNLALVDAIAGLGMAPFDLKQKLLVTLQQMSERYVLALAAQKQYKVAISKQDLRYLTEQNAKVAREQFSHLPLGQVRTTQATRSGSLIKLQIDIGEHKATFDFTGTESNLQAQLTDLATFGICFSILKKAAGGQLTPNAESFDLLEVKSVRGSQVYATGSQGLVLGMAEFAGELSEILTKALAKNRSSLISTSSDIPPAQIQLTFAGAKSLHLALPAALPVNAEPGKPAVSRSLFSIEQFESHFPLRFKSVQEIPGGKGRQSGSSGLSVEFELLKPARLEINTSVESAKGASGGENGAQQNYVIVRNDSSSESIPEAKISSLKIDLTPGDTVQISGGSGGAFEALSENID